MASWTGFIALGVYSGGVFTELSAGTYSRRPWTFTAALGGRASSPIGASFGTVSGGADWTWNAVAFYPALTGGTPQMVYPLPVFMTAPAGTPAFVQPADVVLNTVDYVGLGGGVTALTPTQVGTITGLPAGGSLPANVLTFGP